MGFDRAGAKAAGYSDEEINAYLGQGATQAPNYSKMPDSELEARANGTYSNTPDYSKMTDAQLEALASGQPLPDKYTREDIKSLKSSYDPGGADYVPQWGQKSPNIYAGTMALLDAIPAAASFAGKAKVGIPLAAAVSSAAGYAKRRIGGVDTEFADVANDAMKGAGIEGAGRGIGAVLSKGVTNPLSEWLAGKALKFSTSPKVLPPADKKEITRTFLEKNMWPSEGSWLKLQEMLNVSGAAKGKAIQEATDAGVTFSPFEAIQKGGLADLLKMGKGRERATEGYGGQVADKIINFARDGKRMTPNELDLAKMQFQQSVANGYASNTSHLADIQAAKQLGAGSAAVLESIPGVAAANAESESMYKLAPHLARSIGRIANADIIGLKEATLIPQAITAGDMGKSAGLAALYRALVNPTTQIAAAKTMRWVGNIAGKRPMERKAFRTGLEGALYSASGGLQD